MRLLLLVGLAACSGTGGDTGSDSKPGDTGPDDTGGPTGPTLAEADAAFVGPASSGAGSAVAGVGDLDGDTHADVLIAAFYGNRACVFAGPIADGTHTLDEGACLDGEAVYDFAGYAASRAGEIDGVGGFLVSAIGNDDGGIEAGKVYLIRGMPAPGATPLADAPVAWIGEAPGDYAGTSVAAAGDVDGDGVDDVLVGASGNDAGGNNAGRVYLLRGPFADGEASLGDAAWATFSGTSTTTPAEMIVGHGAVSGGDALGDAVAGLGDIDGDGFGDILLGASGSDVAGEDAGEVWVVRGPVAEGAYVAADADARLIGPGPGAFTGGAVAGPGDLDGDGLADLLVAADAWGGGRVYVLLGPVADGEGSLTEAGPVLDADTEEDLAGWAVSGAGDTDGDGRREVLVGAPGLDGGGLDGGGIFLVHDPARPGVRLLSEAGERWDGEAVGDSAGRAAAGVGDTNGDGLDDLLVGALYNQEGGVFAGKGYLLRGR